jgi:general secretion pathway protein G
MLATNTRNKGFTLLELMIVVAIMGVLAAIAIPNYIAYIERARHAVALNELRQIDREVNMFFISNNSYPLNLAQIGYGNLRDPWGNLYRYLNHDTVQGVGQLRKDGSTFPINNDFDLYSMGPDGRSSLSFKPNVSHDDIVRANNGSYFGRVSDY